MNKKEPESMFYGESIGDMSGLSALACHAATYIDALVIGARLDKSFSHPVEILVSRLDEVKKYSSKPDSPTDPSVVLALRDALKKVSGREIQYLDDLVSKVALIGQDLRDINRLSKTKKEFLRDFCLELSKSASNPNYSSGCGPCRLVA